jgi:ABC-type hemin transport system substrate-binding protein
VYDAERIHGISTGSRGRWYFVGGSFGEIQYALGKAKFIVGQGFLISNIMGL